MGNIIRRIKAKKDDIKIMLLSLVAALLAVALVWSTYHYCGFEFTVVWLLMMITGKVLWD